MNNSCDFISLFQGKLKEKVPFWFMRQAGRYLPEYRAVRKDFSNFLDFCYNPEAATEVTLQPIRRYGMSAAIIFSDILVIPDALGVSVQFEQGHGPILEPVNNLEKISMFGFKEKLDPVYQAIKMTRGLLPADKALIGFCGLPWTLACYMVEGKGSRDFSSVRTVSYCKKEFFSQLISLLTDAVIEHSLAQIEAGADVIKLFDSWAGVLSEQEFFDYSITPSKKIVAAIKEKHPLVPVIGFPRMAGSKAQEYARLTGVDAVSFDGSVSLGFASGNIGEFAIPQGNLDNILLAYDKEGAINQTKKILDNFRGKKFIFNLAHGVIPQTPPENLAAVCEVISSYSG